jgi:hypothetical protein
MFVCLVQVDPVAELKAAVAKVNGTTARVTNFQRPDRWASGGMARQPTSVNEVTQVE